MSSKNHDLVLQITTLLLIEENQLFSSRKLTFAPALNSNIHNFLLQFPHFQKSTLAQGNFCHYTMQNRFPQFDNSNSQNRVLQKHFSKTSTTERKKTKNCSGSRKREDIPCKFHCPQKKKHKPHQRRLISLLKVKPLLHRPST